jgi:hypothetical protein
MQSSVCTWPSTSRTVTTDWAGENHCLMPCFAYYEDAKINHIYEFTAK